MKNGAVFGIVVLSFVQAACGSDEGLATSPGASVLRPEVTQVSLRSLGGGFRQLPPAGAACDPGVSTYTVAFAPATLTYSRCQVSGDYSVAASFVPQSGQLTLAPAQLAMVRTAVGAVTVSDQRTCGADKGTVELEADTATHSLTYGDDFYGCMPMYSVFVHSGQLDNLYSVLSPLPG